jgi:hypothetical protein
MKVVHIGRIAFLLSLAMVWLVLVASTLVASAGLFEATRRPVARVVEHSLQPVPCAQADGGSTMAGRAN